MTAFTLATITITGVVSFTAGYLLKHFQDNRHIDELISMFESTMSRMTAEWRQIEKRYILTINRLQAENRMLTSAKPTVIKKAEVPDWLKTFLDTSEPLPESGLMDIDFPNNGKEDK